MISLRDAWSNHQNCPLRQRAMIDALEWADDVFVESNPFPQNFDHFSQEIAKVYGDKDQCRVAVFTLMQEFIRVPQESVRAYANCIKANWRQTGWNLQKHEEVLYDISWAGLCNSPMNIVRPLTPAGSRFDTLDEIFAKAAPLEVIHVKNKQPHKQPQQNVNRSSSHTQSCQTLRVTSPVLLSTSRCSQAPLELSTVLSDSPRAVSGAPESTCSYGGAFRMLRDLTYRIVKCWSSWDVCAHLREALQASETAAQLSSRCREQPRPLCSWAGDLVPYSHTSGSYITTRHLVLSYLSLLQSQDSLHYNMACIIYISVYVYTYR